MVCSSITQFLTLLNKACKALPLAPFQALILSHMLTYTLSISNWYGICIFPTLNFLANARLQIYPLQTLISHPNATNSSLGASQPVKTHLTTCDHVISSIYSSTLWPAPRGWSRSEISYKSSEINFKIWNINAKFQPKKKKMINACPIVAKMLIASARYISAWSHSSVTHI